LKGIDFRGRNMSGLDECTIVRGSNIDSHYIVNAYDYGMTEYERVGHQRLPLSYTSSVAPRDARHTATPIPLVPRFGFQGKIYVLNVVFQIKI